MFIYALLLGVKLLSRLFYRHETQWVGSVPADPWADVRVLALLNHTSLYEPLFAGGAPNRLLKQIAACGVIPAAEKTLKRPIVGRFFRLVAQEVVPVSRQRDHTWKELMCRIRPDSLVLILPEGRMKRASGLDLNGKPMTVRGGIADILSSVHHGRLLLAYSCGLHHVQVPGQLLPKLFKTLRMRFETLDIRPYRDELAGAAGSDEFKRSVIRDLEARRDRYCAVDALPFGRSERRDAEWPDGSPETIRGSTAGCGCRRRVTCTAEAPATSRNENSGGRAPSTRR